LISTSTRPPKAGDRRLCFQSGGESMPVKKRVTKVKAHRVTPQAGEVFREVVRLRGDALRAERALTEAEQRLSALLGGSKPWLSVDAWQDYHPATVGSTGMTPERHEQERAAYDVFLELLQESGISFESYCAMVYRGETVDRKEDAE
jgi:hypothetical protein